MRLRKYYRRHNSMWTQSWLKLFCTWICHTMSYNWTERLEDVSIRMDSSHKQKLNNELPEESPITFEENCDPNYFHLWLAASWRDSPRITHAEWLDFAPIPEWSASNYSWFPCDTTKFDQQYVRILGEIPVKHSYSWILLTDCWHLTYYSTEAFL